MGKIKLFTTTKQELILVPIRHGDTWGFTIPKKRMRLEQGKQYRIFIEKL